MTEEGKGFRFDPGGSITRTAQSKTFTRAFSNSHRLRLSRSELQITFSVLTDLITSDGKNVPAYTDEATVILGFSQVKSLVAELVEIVKAHEKLIGGLEPNYSNVPNVTALAERVFAKANEPG